MNGLSGEGWGHLPGATSGMVDGGESIDDGWWTVMVGYQAQSSRLSFWQERKMQPGESAVGTEENIVRPGSFWNAVQSQQHIGNRI